MPSKLPSAIAVGVDMLSRAELICTFNLLLFGDLRSIIGYFLEFNRIELSIVYNRTIGNIGLKRFIDRQISFLNP